MRVGHLIAAVVAVLLAFGSRAQSLADFGFNASPLPTSRPVLLILPSYPGLTRTGTSLQWHQLVFDSVTSDFPPRYSVAQWASENSNGRFTITPAGPLPISVAMTAGDSYNAISGANPDWDDKRVNFIWIGRIVKALIDSGFDFLAFDSNRNAIVECPSELTLCIINPATDNNGGVVRQMETQQDAGATFSVRGGSIIVGHRVQFDTILHEFGHSFGVPYELYTPVENAASVNTGMSIMSGTGYGDGGADRVFSDDWTTARMHFDPYHKLRFGWSAPRIVSLRAGGRVHLPVATSGAVDAPVILYDPLRGTHEYFILEYRSRFQPSANYDASFAVTEPVTGEGLVIWHVATRPDHSLFESTDRPLFHWTPGDPMLSPPAYYYSSIMCRNPPDLNSTNNRPWSSGRVTPALKWFDGSVTSARIQVLPFAGAASSITVDVLAGYETWVDFAYVGPETGAFATPHNTFAEGIANVSFGGRVRIKAGQTSETVAKLNKPMTLEAFGTPGSTAVIGR